LFPLYFVLLYSQIFLTFEGGSFSSYFARPKYQDAAVTAYLNSIASPPPSFFNSSGRAYNDLALLGDNVLITYNGSLAIVGGTSASGPILAGVVSLINNARINAGKSPLGFMNPLLYFIAQKFPEAFNTINATGFDNSCTYSIYNEPLSCCPYGFVGTSSWNPLTGNQLQVII
jgi:tripeptidyl-peptidase-1